MKTNIKRWPIIGSLAALISGKDQLATKAFHGSEHYWKNRYRAGRNSGHGSYNKLAEFKAEIINKFVIENNISNVIEYGCGDGNQLRLATYPAYTGFDVSPEAIARCLQQFAGDSTKSFYLMGAYQGETAELTLSLDVIYHLVEDAVFVDYAQRLFASAERFVIIYSSNTDSNPPQRAAHVKHREFTQWVTANQPEWQLIQHIPNKYPYNGDSKSGSFADFYIYSKI